MGGRSIGNLKNHRRIHIRSYGKRTSVSVPEVLFRLLALKLDCDQNSEDARIVVKQWVQDEVNRGGFLGTGLSQEISTRIVFAIADPEIFRKEWEMEKKRP